VSVQHIPIGYTAFLSFILSGTIMVFIAGLI
jgi:hypothetical protein